MWLMTKWLCNGDCALWTRCCVWCEGETSHVREENTRRRWCRRGHMDSLPRGTSYMVLDCPWCNIVATCGFETETELSLNIWAPVPSKTHSLKNPTATSSFEWWFKGVTWTRFSRSLFPYPFFCFSFPRLAGGQMALTVEETSLIKWNVFFPSEVSFSERSSGFITGCVSLVFYCAPTLLFFPKSFSRELCWKSD